MACLRSLEVLGSSTWSQGRCGSSSQCGTALQTRAHPEAGRLPRLTIVCKKGQGRRTSRSNLRPKPRFLEETEVTESSSHAVGSITNEQKLDSTSTSSTLKMALTQATVGSGSHPVHWKNSAVLKAKTVSSNTLAAMRSRAKVLMCSEEAVQKLPSQALPAAAGAATIAVVGYFVASFLFSVAHHIVSGFGKALSKIPAEGDDGRFLLATSRGTNKAGELQLPSQQQQWSSSGAFTAAGSGKSDLQRSSRSASLVPSSNLNRSKVSKRVPLVVSAASPSAIYEQNTEESEWLNAEPVSGSSLYAGFKQPSKNAGRTPLVVSAAAPAILYVAAGPARGQIEVLTGQEVKVKAVLDPSWAPTFHREEEPEPVDVLEVFHDALESEENGSPWSKDTDRDETVALAASLAAQQMMEMEKAQEQQIAAMKRAAQLEAKVLEERHKKQLAMLEAQLSAVRKEASIASTIAKHLLESDSGNVVTIKKGESASNGALPWHKPANPSPTEVAVEFDGGVLKFEHMSKEMRELVRSFNSVLEMKLSKESAHRQAVEERLREAEVEHRILREKFEEAMAHSKLQPPLQEATTEAAAEYVAEASGWPAPTPVAGLESTAEQESRSAYLADLRRKLADAQTSLFKERLRAEEKEKAAADLEAQLHRTVKERNALRLESFQNTTKELAAAQELLAAQAKANLEITSALQHLMEEAPVLQAQLAEARMELEREREARKADVDEMRKAVGDARAEAAALRVEAVRMEEQFLMEIQELQKVKGSKGSLNWSSRKT